MFLLKNYMIVKMWKLLEQLVSNLVGENILQG